MLQSVCLPPTKSSEGWEFLTCGRAPLRSVDSTEVLFLLCRRLFRRRLLCKLLTKGNAVPAVPCGRAPPRSIDSTELSTYLIGRAPCEPAPQSPQPSRPAPSARPGMQPCRRQLPTSAQVPRGSQRACHRVSADCVVVLFRADGLRCVLHLQATRYTLHSLLCLFLEGTTCIQALCRLNNASVSNRGGLWPLR